MTCGTVSSDDHPINIKGSRGPYRFVKTLDTANAKAAPTTNSSGSASADRPGPAANTTTPAAVGPLVYAVPVQLIAYHTAVALGTDVDQPRNLAKSVTVE